MRFTKYCLLLLLLFFSGSVLAQQVVQFLKETNQGYIGKSVFCFTDSSNRLSIDEVKNTARFTKSDRLVPNLGVSQYTYWIRFDLKNLRGSELVIDVGNTGILEPEFYLQTKHGINRINTEEGFGTRAPHYILYLAQNEQVRCYIKLRSNAQLQVPLQIDSVKNFYKKTLKAQLLSGIYLGIMCVMLLYNLFVYSASRDRSYLYYVHYILWVVLTQASFLGFFGKIIGHEGASYFLILSGAMSGIATVMFARSFLLTDLHTPILNRLLNIVIVGDIISIVFLVFRIPVVAYNIVNVVAGLGSLYVLFLAYWIYRKGYRPAGYFLLSWSVFLSSVIIFVLKDYQVFPYNYFTGHIVQIGSAIEAILLSFALANKINILISDNEKSQAQALRVATENERIIREQNVLLEIKVDERTHELKETNEQLNRTLIDLQEAQEKLIESEKMASLGQLTAGIAHEINNPINFVTSNISPLQRNLNMLLDAFDHVEKVAISDEAMERKVTSIISYKDNLDFEYLKLEIKQLLKGMYEGASRTADIVKGLRIFSREDDDSLKKANVNESLESTMIILNTLIGNIKIVKEYGAVPLLNCYPGKLNQVYLNIVTNCLHAINKKFQGEPGGELLLFTSNDEQNMIIRIKDNGTGMSEEVQRKLFEPFFTTKDVGEGTGLGMYISYNIIKKHFGDIMVNTAEGKGTEFIITLPLDLKEAAEILP